MIADIDFDAVMTGKSRPSTDVRDWRLCGDEYGGQCVINSDGVIVMSTVLAF